MIGRGTTLLSPTSADDSAAIHAEVEKRLSEGYKCLKIKVGKDVEADLRRVAHCQDAIAGRGTLRLDANRAYYQEEGERFAASLYPDAIELFEQPCAAEDWNANAAVSAAPLMLDEPICSLDDIKQAGTIDHVGLCKLKLKRFDSLDKLAKGLQTVRICGMPPVLRDGLGSDLHI
jgi:L-alanine-DL-glutamate epimerase-like enolase superfamily enzyme